MKMATLPKTAPSLMFHTAKECVSHLLGRYNLLLAVAIMILYGIP